MNMQLVNSKLFSLSQRCCSLLLSRAYAKPPAAKGKLAGALGKAKIGKAGPIVEKIKIPVEKDTNRLVNYVCGTNIYIEGGEDIKLKPESEYPDWLWEIHTGPPKQLEELDKNTKAYWRRLRKMAEKRNNKLSKLKKFH